MNFSIRFYIVNQDSNMIQVVSMGAYFQTNPIQDLKSLSCGITAKIRNGFIGIIDFIEAHPQIVRLVIDILKITLPILIYQHIPTHQTIL